MVEIGNDKEKLVTIDVSESARILSLVLPYFLPHTPTARLLHSRDLELPELVQAYHFADKYMMDGLIGDLITAKMM